MNAPKISLLIATYQRAAHLARVLASVAIQKNVSGLLEVVVSDDGSTDHTAEVVERFKSSVDFPVRFTPHRHDGFQLAKCRNDGVRASTGDYIVFLDGDCLMPPDFLATHLQRKRTAIAQAGFCCYLDRTTSEKITVENILTEEFVRLIPHQSRNWAMRMHWKSEFYNFIRHPSKPKLFGGNVGIHRADFERVNGYDENFLGWGCEDDDLRIRLRQAGVGIQSIARWTRTFHLWHPPAPSKPETWRDGENVAYFMRVSPASRCEKGLAERSQRVGSS